MFTRVPARHRSSAARSVLTAANPTSRTDAEIMRLTALPPAPPAPTTVTLGRARPCCPSMFVLLRLVP
jgi:hypothetical protein